MSDIRLYTYGGGTLRALGNKQRAVHRFTSVIQCKRVIKILQENHAGKRQYVMVEYTGTESSIIYVSPLDLNKIL